jgi:PQQ-like domain
MSASMILVPTAIAHTPPWQIPTFAYINVSPNPVGAGEQVLVVFWLDKTFDSELITNDYRFHNFILTITNPNGTTETKTFDYITDTTSSQYTTYVPDIVGTYTFNFTFPAQDYNKYSHSPTSAYVNDTYLGSSAQTTLTVQQEPIPGPPTYPLPTEYWTRPIEGQNTAWAAVASNYLYPMAAAYTFGAVRLQPDGTAPNSAHILWTKPINFGGVVGGDTAVHDPYSPSAATGVEDATYYTGLSYESRFSNPIIIYGKLYYPLPRGDAVQAGLGTSAGGGYVCVDLRTGEQLWWQNYTVNPSFGSLEWFDSPNQHGTIPNGYLWATTTSAGVTTWIAYDPLDGNWLFNITNVPSGTLEFGPSGEPIIYQFDAANKWLALWNLTQVITNGEVGALGFTGYRPVGTVINSTQRDAYSWNITNLNVPSGSRITWPVYNDLILGCANTLGGYPSFGGAGARFNYVSPATFWAISLKPTSMGQLLWTKNYAEPAGSNLTMQLGPVDPVNRVFFISTRETMQWYGYGLDDGNQLWGPVGNARPFNYYATIGSGGVAQIGYVAYGNLYTGGYGGEIFCFDSKTGNLVWSYGGDGEGNSTNSGDNTAWGLYPIFIGAIADGKVYAYSGEHSPNAPPYKGELMRCLNATTGKEIWTMDSWATVGGFSDLGFPIADGEMAYLNAYDMQVYAIGKGPTHLTVTAPDTAAAFGSPVVIRGTVADISAGTEQDVIAKRFPNGVPAVSEGSMSAWMKYVYMQKPRPNDVTGVEVTLSVLDSNNNFREIGTTNSDANGFFHYTWTPDISGDYTVVATFAGSEGYWPSQAETAFTVMEASPTTPPVETPPDQSGTYIMYAAIAIIIVIIVAVAVAVLILRKR